MYKDVITYELADGVTDEHMVTVARKVAQSWMKLQPGFISWKINRSRDGSYCDIVSWTSEVAAKIADTKRPEMPNRAEWLACYKEGRVTVNQMNLVITYR